MIRLRRNAGAATQGMARSQVGQRAIRPSMAARWTSWGWSGVPNADSRNVLHDGPEAGGIAECHLPC
jgi:hypothetical protein